jgi:hypothetical protein
MFAVYSKALQTPFAAWFILLFMCLVLQAPNERICIKRAVHSARYRRFYEAQFIFLPVVIIRRSSHQIGQDVPPELRTWIIDLSTIEIPSIMLNLRLGSFSPTHIAELDYPTLHNGL